MNGNQPQPIQGQAGQAPVQAVEEGEADPRIADPPDLEAVHAGHALVEQLAARAQAAEQSEREARARLEAALRDPEQARREARLNAQAEQKRRELRVYRDEMNRLHNVIEDRKGALRSRKKLLQYAMTRYTCAHRAIFDAVNAATSHYNPLIDDQEAPWKRAAHLREPQLDIVCNAAVGMIVATSMLLMHLCTAFVAMYYSQRDEDEPYAWNIPVYSAVFVVFTALLVPFNGKFRANYYLIGNRIMWWMAKGYQLAIIVYLIDPWWLMTPRVHKLFVVLLWTDLVTLEWMTSSPEDQLLNYNEFFQINKHEDIHAVWSSVKWRREISPAEEAAITRASNLLLPELERIVDRER